VTSLGRKRAANTGARCAHALLAVILISAIPAHADQRDKLESLRHRIEEMQVEMDRTSESKAVAADALKESERSISHINRKLKNLEAKLRSTDSALSKLKLQQRRLNANMEEQESAIGDLLYRRYINGNRAHLNLLLNKQDPNMIARELTYYRYIAIDRARQLDEFHSDYLALSKVTAEIGAQREQLDEVRAEQASEKDALRKQKQARQRTLATISRQLRSQRREFKQLQGDENRLARLVEKIEKMLDSGESGSLVKNDKFPDDRFDNLAFDQLKGKLTLPVKGAITNRFGELRPDSSIVWKGLFLRTSSGQAVKAVAAGQVVFADWLRGFGNLMIIDHGDGYMSLYGYNESLYKEVGEQVHGGDTVASTGNSGGSEEYGLYFELRHKSKPFDPVKWLSKR
jgi:septal ring factor EnvC (AmiA/AmiB activator)